MYIWIVVGLEPKLVTCCSDAEKPTAAHDASARKDEKSMMEKKTRLGQLRNDQCSLSILSYLFCFLDTGLYSFLDKHYVGGTMGTESGVI